MDQVLKYLYEGIKILSKVFAIWDFLGEKTDYDYNRDFPVLKENFETILDQFK